MEIKSETHAVGKAEGLVMNSSTDIKRPLIAVAILALSTNAFGQRSLRELARETSLREPNAVLNLAPSPEHFEAKSVEDLTTHSIIVVTGRLARLGSYLSSKENYVLTDYAITDVTVLRGQLPVRGTSVPGQVDPLIVSVWGGEVVLDGVRIRAVNESFDSLRERTQYLLFLKPPPSPEIRGYDIYNAAIFEISAQRVKPLLKRGNHVFSWAEDVTLPDLIARIQSAGKAR
jgi:hypothetical protein